MGSEQSSANLAVTFAPSDYLLGVVQGSIAAKKNVSISLPGGDEVILLPERNAYHARVRDMSEFSRAPVAEFQVRAVKDDVQASAENPARHVSELLWQASFYVSEGRLPEGCSRHDVVQFRRWANLTRLPSSPNAARIFALLTRYPTTLMLVNCILGVERDEVYRIYSAAHSAGLVNVVHSFARSADAAEADAAVSAEEARVKADTQAERSWFRYLRNKIAEL